MEVKKGYKQTDVGVIPEDWVVKPMSDIGHVIRGASPRPKGNKRYYGGSIPRLMVEDITRDKHWVTPSIDYLTNEGAKLSRLCKRGTLAIVCSGTPTAVGLPALLATDTCIHDGILALVQINEGASSDFLFHQLGSLQQRLHAVATHGGTFVNLTTEAFRAFEVATPPTKAEQTVIAAALSDADALIQSLEKLIAKKRSIKLGAMQELLKPKEGWVVKKLGDLFSISGGYSASRDQLSNEGYCYLHYGDIHGARKTFIDVSTEYSDIPKLNIPIKKVSPKSLLNDGDIVFVDASEDDEGTSKHIVVKNPDGVPYISGLHTIVAKSKDDTVDNDYKRYCFQSACIKSQFKFYAVGTKVSGISKTNIAKIEIALPSLKEQTRIATILSDMDAEISSLETKLAKYKQIKQGMMQNLLTGRTRLI